MSTSMSSIGNGVPSGPEPPPRVYVFGEGGEAFSKWWAAPSPDNEFSQDKSPYPVEDPRHQEWDTGWEDGFQIVCRSWETFDD